jgi:peptide/nickel transport system substrate-binding protein
VYNDNVSISDIPIHNTSWLFDSNEYTEYDAEKSKQLLINCGWKQENGNSWSKKINNQNYILKASLMVNSDNEERCKAANIIKDNLSELGISVTINKVDWSTYKLNLESGNFDLALGGFDVISEFDIISLLSKDGNLNYAGYENEKMENLFSTVGLGQINLEPTFDSILEEYRKEVPYIGLYFRTNILITNKSVDGEIIPSWWNVYNNICSWSK